MREFSVENFELAGVLRLHSVLKNGVREVSQLFGRLIDDVVFSGPKNYFP
jgi:hypothetical protein